MGHINNILFFLLVTLLTVACLQNDELSETATNVPVLATAGSYLAYSEAKEIYQNSLIVLELPDNFFAEEITLQELQKYQRSVSASGEKNGYATDRMFPNFMAYMGSEDGYHFFMYKAYFEGRKILKIKDSEYRIARPTPLSTNMKNWNWVNPFYQFNMQELSPIDLNGSPHIMLDIPVLPTADR